MSDIVERLRDWASNSTGCNPANAPCAEAADEIERLRVALQRAERKLAAYVGVCKDDKELTGAVLPMVRAALSDSPATQGDGWLPIESAPKDGSMILLSNSRTNVRFVGGWTPDVYEEDGPYWTDVGNQNAAITVAINSSYFDYWRPLPPLPTRERAMSERARILPQGYFGRSILIDMPPGCDMIVVFADVKQHVPVWLGLPHQLYLHTAAELTRKHEADSLTIVPYRNADKVQITLAFVASALLTAPSQEGKAKMCDCPQCQDQRQWREVSNKGARDE